MAEVWSISLPTDKRRSKPVSSPGIVSVIVQFNSIFIKEGVLFFPTCRNNGSLFKQMSMILQYKLFKMSRSSLLQNCNSTVVPIIHKKLYTCIYYAQNWLLFWIYLTYLSIYMAFCRYFKPKTF